MKLSDIISISGKPGLYKIIGRRPAGLIVETLDEQAKRFPTSVTQKISILQDIAMYTYEGDEKLAVVLRSLDEKVGGGLALVNRNSSGDEIRSFFRQILPEFDEERVYTSDILKLLSWYQILKSHTDLNELLQNDDETSEANALEESDKTGIQE